jgi:hypothetical protein
MDSIVLSMDDDKMFKRLNNHATAIGLTTQVAWMNPEAANEAQLSLAVKEGLHQEARYQFHLRYILSFAE